ncbi:hypothetical protein QR680_017954 [Steinernema hermaphroditum]|uniref:Hexosyltransferase n=1 Tax=Steinernema hermaphroditum TaxID=289476 RepID=A0AA39LPZ0_9BILA|nr:hypothetical protein QR680_017954 [Steinernema hermaphroditum]
MRPIVRWQCSHIGLGVLLLIVVVHISVLFAKTWWMQKCRQRDDRHWVNYGIHSLEQLNVPVMAQPLNWINFTLLQLPRFTCDGEPLNLVVIVHSAVTNTDRRNFMRREYFNKINQKHYNAKPIFVLGRSRVAESNELVRQEAASFGDILQIDVEENYHNITHKARAWIPYLKQNCGNMKYILKMDDDVMMDMQGLQILLDHYQLQKRLVLCRTFADGVVVRNPRSKWYLSREEYPIDNLGLYCQGMAYVFSGDLLRYMDGNLRKVQYLWMDDWYVTHGLLRAANAIFVDIGRHYVSINSEQELDSVAKGPYKKYRKLFGHFRPAERYPLAERVKIWSRLEDSTTCY